MRLLLTDSKSYMANNAASADDEEEEYHSAGIALSAKDMDAVGSPL